MAERWPVTTPGGHFKNRGQSVQHAENRVTYTRRAAMLTLHCRAADISGSGLEWVAPPDSGALDPLSGTESKGASVWI